MVRLFFVVLSGLLITFGGATVSGAKAQTCTSYPYTLTNGTNADATQVMANFAYVVSCVSALIPTSSGSTSPPQGRLTLVTGTPVMTSSQASKTTIYYTAYAGNVVPIYNGTAFVPFSFSSDLSNITTNSATGNAGPAAVAANSNYDLFVWQSSGTLYLTRGPAWTSQTARGTGSGTTQLQRVQGIWTNQYAITNGPAANQGTYVGTVASDGSAQINWVPGGLATNGAAGVLGVWNAYNRVAVAGIVGDSTSTWTYTTPTWRAANGSNTMRVSFVHGLQEDFFAADYTVNAGNSGGGDFYMAGVGYDSTSAVSGGFSLINTAVASYTAPVMGRYAAQPLGFHYMQALEYSVAAGVTTWYGNNSGGGAPIQNNLVYSGRF